MLVRTIDETIDYVFLIFVWQACCASTSGVPNREWVGCVGGMFQRPLDSCVVGDGDADFFVGDAHA
jgi:hypothetical protein